MYFLYLSFRQNALTNKLWKSTCFGAFTVYSSWMHFTKCVGIFCCIFCWDIYKVFERKIRNINFKHHSPFLSELLLFNTNFMLNLRKTGSSISYHVCLCSVFVIYFVLLLFVVSLTKTLKIMILSMQPFWKMLVKKAIEEITSLFTSFILLHKCS